MTDGPEKLDERERKTLAILQQMSQHGSQAKVAPQGKVTVLNMPVLDRGRFRLGEGYVLAEDAAGLNSEAVWESLHRKGLVAEYDFPNGIVLTPEGLNYQTGMEDIVVRGE